MTLLSVVQDVCATVGVMMPQSVFSNISGNRTAQEMLALANEQAQRIAYNYRDWTRLRTTAVFAGNGEWLPPQPDPLAVWTGTSAFNLPANFKRLLLTSNVYLSTSPRQPMLFIPDTNDWMQRRSQNSGQSSWGEWTIYGGQMHIFPIMPVGTSAFFVYLDKNCIGITSGGQGDRFMSDSDTFLLDERLLKLAMTWTWKSQKGSPYGEDLATYGDAMAFEQAHDGPSPILVGGYGINNDTSGGWNAILR